MGGLTVDSLTKKFDTIVAVKDFNIEINDGEFIVIVGPSGCGKTTTLNCIAGLEEPTEGEITLDNEMITHASPQERDVAMVFQSYALYPHMDVSENLSFGLRMSTDYDADEIDMMVTETAEVLGIDDHLDNQPGELSGGQRQRVALGRAIIRDPELFLMDEPLSNLDAKLRTEMRTELLRLQDDLEVTTVYVTHDQTEAMTMADRIAIMDDGVLQQVATPLDLYYEPVNMFVAQFIGDPSMNIFSMEATADNGAITFQGNEFTLQISDPTPEEAGLEGPVDVGIRPEAITFAEPGTDSPNIVDVDIDVVEPMGDVTYVHFTLNRESYTATVPGRQIPEEKQTVSFALSEDSLYVFDRSGETVRHPQIEPEERTVADVY